MGIEITLTSFLLPVLIAYALGALPVAYTIGRINGINVFEVGSHQAGATNIWREVSRKQGVIVTAVDAIKGLTAILLARHMGLEGAELLIPAGAAIAGHWNSPFTKFKGGDGVVTLMGVAIGIVPLAKIAPLSLDLLIAVSLNSKLSHPSLWGGEFSATCYLSLYPSNPVRASTRLLSTASQASVCPSCCTVCTFTNDAKNISDPQMFWKRSPSQRLDRIGRGSSLSR